ncbi:hypothetical protein Bca4012_008204 [Brassica carinata]
MARKASAVLAVVMAAILVVETAAIMSKPYGRFHVLPDFDEGKRSCWRKLERHHNIRKRKPVDKGGVASKQQQVNRYKSYYHVSFDDGKSVSEQCLKLQSEHCLKLKTRLMKVMPDD